MKKRELFINEVVNILFCIAVVTCCIVLVYALIFFIRNCVYIKNTISDLVNDYDEIWSVQTMNSDVVDKTYHTNVENDFDDIEYETMNQIRYMESLIDYTMKLQELEAQATSTNLMTFIYTFLSGTLIGIATFFTKKCSDSIKQIRENKELITDLDRRTLFAGFYMHVQRTYSTMQIFILSLDAIQDDNVLSVFIDKYVPKINDFMHEMVQFVKDNQENMHKMSSEDQQHILEEINGIGNLINHLHLPNENGLLSNQEDGAKNIWEYQLRQVKKMVKH